MSGNNNNTQATIQRAQRIRLLKDNNSILILVALLFVAFIAVDGFTTSFYNVILYSAEFGICCLGLSLVMVTGNIDLSVGYMAAFSGVIFVMTFNAVYESGGSVTAAMAAAVIAAIAIGGLMGTFNGFIVTKIGVSPLIATIATNYIYEGLVFNWAKSTYSPDDKGPIQTVAKTQLIEGVRWLTPMTIIFVAFVVAVFLWMYFTRFGSRLHIVGDNPEAAEFAGISVAKTTWVTFILCGLMAGVTGLLLVSFNGSASYTQGTTLSTFPISCCVIGGIKMSGGKGTAVHVLLGVLIMRTISTMMTTMFWTTDKINLVTGILLVVVLIVDRFTSTKDVDE